MSSSAGQPISPTLSPEVQEVMADWAKTLEAPGANPGLLPMHGVGGDRRSRRRLERHLRARHAEELGWFYGWKRFLAASDELGVLLVNDRRAEQARLTAPSIVRSASNGSLGPKPTALDFALEAHRWSPSAAYAIQLAFHEGDRDRMGGERDWRRASVGLSNRSARMDSWRADAAKLSFDSGDYLRAAGLYVANHESRGSSIEACAAFVAAVLAGESAVIQQAMVCMAMADNVQKAIKDYAIGISVSAPVVEKLGLRASKCGDSSVRTLAADIIEQCPARGGPRERPQ